MAGDDTYQGHDALVVSVARDADLPQVQHRRRRQFDDRRILAAEVGLEICVELLTMVLDSTAGLYGDLQGIAGRTMAEIESLDILMIKDGSQRAAQ
jgi:hypothetical protein